MDRPTTRTEADARGSRLDPAEAIVLPSRRPALDLCRASSRGEGRRLGGAPTGPVLLTGDAGVGKTWLWRRLEAEANPGRRWVAVDLTPSDDPADFYRLIGHELGLVDPSVRHPATSRVELVDFLVAREADGERIHLVVEEAQNLSSDLWEEIRVLANRLDRPGGFASMMLVGQTSLAIRFSTRPFAAIEARLASRVHLGPIGVDEASDLLAGLRPVRPWPEDEVETLHRDAAGNPGKLLRLAGSRLAPALARMDGRILDEGLSEEVVAPALGHEAGEPADRLVEAETSPTEEPGPIAATGPASNPSPLPLIGPAKPPIRFEENMIEVGWAPDDPAPASDRGQEARARVGHPVPSEGGEEAVQDHYAALQAWREWSENQARRSPRPAGVADEEGEDEPEYEDDAEDERTSAPSPRADRPTVRAEGEQKFAPFGQLFSRMAQAREPE